MGSWKGRQTGGNSGRRAGGRKEEERGGEGWRRKGVSRGEREGGMHSNSSGGVPERLGAGRGLPEASVRWGGTAPVLHSPARSWAQGHPWLCSCDQAHLAWLAVVHQSHMPSCPVLLPLQQLQPRPQACALGQGAMKGLEAVVWLRSDRLLTPGHSSSHTLILDPNHSASPHSDPSH